MKQQKTTKLKLNDLQLDSTYIEEIQDIEAATINGGAGTTENFANDGGTDTGFDASISALRAAFNEAQARNMMLRQVTTVEGTELKATGKNINPK